jgi:hypothetical protein
MSKRTRLRSGFTTSRAQQGLPHGRQRTAISTAAVAASVLQARIAAAIREEQVAAAKAATKRKELTALRSELSMFATQAAGSNAQPLGRRVHAPRAGAVRPPDLAEHI